VKLQQQNWKKYALEFLSIFIAVISAFALSNWNDLRSNQQSEQKILTEIKNSIEVDIKDFNINIHGNKFSLRADEVFRNLIDNQAVSQDSIALFYTALFRDYVPIINKSAYESFKANNLKTITNDSLRLQIIALYDYSYSIIEALEYSVPEMQSFSNYFPEINTMLYPYMEFNPSTGALIGISPPINLTKIEKKAILSYLWRIRNNRNYKLRKYDSIIKVIKKVKKNIEKELGNNKEY